MHIKIKSQFDKKLHELFRVTKWKTHVYVIQMEGTSKHKTEIEPSFQSQNLKILDM